jgi:RimJ/RimL family protein N-acetyltransferase
MEYPPELTIRYTTDDDAPFLREWLAEPGVLRWFPVVDAPEIEDTIQRWIGFGKYKCSLTAEWDGKPAGIATLWLMPYRKLAHQCQFGMIVGKQFRRRHVGVALINNLIQLAKQRFNIELLHLEVYEGNDPAIALYQQFGFKEFGRQGAWIKENGEYLGRIFMERWI